MSEKNQNKTLLLIESIGYLPATATSKRKEWYGIYQCECGNKITTIIRRVNSGKIKSCGCSRMGNRTHGMHKHRLYFTWINIIRRTTHTDYKSYKNYGGRGIDVCERWLNIANFIEDMYPTYEEGLSIDRINNDKGYYPDNCRWTTNAVQNRNTRRLRSSNSNGWRGVYFNKTAEKWYARISVDNKRKHIGTFNSALEAAMAYDKYVIDNNLEHTTNNIKREKDERINSAEEDNSVS